MTREELEARVAQLEQENSSLKAKNAPKALSCKVSQKGALSIYGLQRFPVTLYREQWERVFDFVPAMKDYIADHNSELTTK